MAIYVTLYIDVGNLKYLGRYFIKFRMLSSIFENFISFIAWNYIFITSLFVVTTKTVKKYCCIQHYIIFLRKREFTCWLLTLPSVWSKGGSTEQSRRPISEYDTTTMQPGNMGKSILCNTARAEVLKDVILSNKIKYVVKSNIYLFNTLNMKNYFSII